MQNKSNHNTDIQIRLMMSVDYFPNKEVTYASMGGANYNQKLIMEHFGHTRSMRFNEVSITIPELHNELTLGKTVCNVFTPPTQCGYDPNKGHNVKFYDEYGLCPAGKRNLFFSGSQIVFVDIDKTDYTLDSFLDVLHSNNFSPTIFYTTYSHLKKEGAHRFRLVYVFDSFMTHFKQYESMAKALNQYITDLTDCTLDPVGTRPAQYFNGTCRTNDDIKVNFQSGYDVNQVYDYEKYAEFFDNLYDDSAIRYWADPKAQAKYIEDIEAEKQIEEEHCNSNNERYKLSARMIEEMVKLGPDKYWAEHRGRTKLYWRTPVSFDDDKDYVNAPEGYFSFFWHAEPLRTGRRRAIRQAMLVRLYVYPEITVNELIYNSWVDTYVYKFYDLKDKKISVYTIKHIAEEVVRYSPQKVQKLIYNSIVKLQYKFRNTKIIFKPGISIRERNTARKEFLRLRISELYDPKKSVKENYEETFNSEYIRVSQTTLYSYCKENDIPYMPQKVVEIETIRLNYDNELTDLENVALLNKLGVNISPSGLCRLLKKHPELRHGEYCPQERKKRKKKTKRIQLVVSDKPSEAYEQADTSPVPTPDYSQSAPVTADIFWKIMNDNVTISLSYPCPA